MLDPAALYGSAAGATALRRLYDATLAALPFPHEQRLVRTASFGHAHVVVCGPSGAPPLVLWHGATTPAPFVLAAPSLAPLVQRLRIYAPDIPCHGEAKPCAHPYGCIQQGTMFLSCLQ